MCTTALGRVTYRNVHYSSRSYVGAVQVCWGAFRNVYGDARDDCSSPTCTILKFMVTHPNAFPKFKFYLLRFAMHPSSRLTMITMCFVQFE
jgi:hypothetical protein